MQYSEVTCGECQTVTKFVVCEWPPKFFWCRDCYKVYLFAGTINSGSTAVWQLRGFPSS